MNRAPPPMKFPYGAANAAFHFDGTTLSQKSKFDDMEQTGYHNIIMYKEGIVKNPSL